MNSLVTTSLLLGAASATDCNLGSGASLDSGSTQTCAADITSCFRSQALIPSFISLQSAECEVSPAYANRKSGLFQVQNNLAQTRCVGDLCNTRNGLTDGFGHWLNDVHWVSAMEFSQQQGTKIRFSRVITANVDVFAPEDQHRLTFGARFEPGQSDRATLESEMGAYLTGKGYTLIQGLGFANPSFSSSVDTLSFIVEMSATTTASQRYIGQTLPESAAMTFSQCQSACVNHAVCAAFTHYASGWCSLFMTTSGTAPAVQATVSGANPYPTCEVLSTTNTFTATPIGSTTLPAGRHEEDCCLACQQNPDCDAWTHHWQGNCDFFQAVTAASPMNAAGSFVITGVVNN